MIRKIIVSIVGALVLLGGSVSLTRYLIEHRPAPGQRDVHDRSPLVDSIELVPTDVTEILHGFGTARADRQAVLRAEIAAAVILRPDNVDDGAAVSKDQLLLQLDDRQYMQELHEARSSVAAADAKLAELDVERNNLGSLSDIAENDLILNAEERDRVRGLFEKGNAPRSEWDSARMKHLASLRAVQELKNQMAMLAPRRLSIEADKSAAQARAERAQLNIERCHIKAPFDGQIERIGVDVGDKVQMGTELLSIVDTDRIEVPLELPVSRRPAARVGADVELRVESMADVEWTGQIVRINPVADPRNRLFQVYVEVDNTRQPVRLMPGSFVKADVTGPIHADALVVPRSAVLDGQVFVANGKMAHVHPVTIGQLIGDRAILVAGVEPGDRVITSNLDMLYDGAPIKTEPDGSGDVTLVDVASTGVEDPPAAPDAGEHSP